MTKESALWIGFVLAAACCGPGEPSNIEGCSTLTGGSAPFVPFEFGTFSPPTGGMIADGTYFATALDGGDSRSYRVQEVYRFSGSHYEKLLAFSDPTRLGGRTSGTYSTSGTQLTFTQTCPYAAVPSPISYDAKGITVVLYDSNQEPGANWITTLTKQ